MPYTIANRRVDLDTLTPEDWRWLTRHPDIFARTYNASCLQFVRHLRQVVQLYADTFVIYGTLLGKIPNYDDITLAANKLKMALLLLEVDISGAAEPDPWLEWEGMAPAGAALLARLSCDAAREIFARVADLLEVITYFFTLFNNLEKLLIPFLLPQTRAIERCLTKASYLFKLELPELLEQLVAEGNLEPLRKIDRITGSIKRELVILATAFKTFDALIAQYTHILLGKAILKREIDHQDCQLIRRREVCYQAAEHIILIPLTEHQHNQGDLKQYINLYLGYIVVVVVAVVTLTIYRIFKVVFA